MNGQRPFRKVMDGKTHIAGCMRSDGRESVPVQLILASPGKRAHPAVAASPIQRTWNIVFVWRCRIEDATQPATTMVPHVVPADTVRSRLRDQPLDSSIHQRYI